MSMATNPAPEDRQKQWANRLDELLRRDMNHSLRTLETRTGINRGTIDSRLKGETPLTVGELELFSAVAKMDPMGLYKYLNGEDTRPTVGGGVTLIGVNRPKGWKLPHLDSNQEPIVSKPQPIADLAAHRARKSHATPSKPRLTLAR